MTQNFSQHSVTSKSEVVVFLGSYDRGKPRVRLLIDGARSVGISVIECHSDIWSDIEDKTQIRGFSAIFRYVVRWLGSRPVLLFRYCRAPAHRSVVIPYPGIFDLLILFPVIKIRGPKIFLDSFISMYDTVVNDRKMLASSSIFAKILFTMEWMAFRVADITFLDTESHSNYLSELFNLSKNRFDYVPVGAEEVVFRRMPYSPWNGKAPLEVLFYGQFVPLQGVMTLLQAIEIWERKPSFPVRWTIIGKGQISKEFDAKLAELGLRGVRRIQWVPYNELPKWIEKSDICCGIFGISKKAINVVPNKVYQVLAVGRPILTANTTGVSSLLGSGPAIELISPDDPMAIVRGINNLGNRLLESPEELKISLGKMPIVGAREVGKRLAEILNHSSC